MAIVSYEIKLSPPPPERSPYVGYDLATKQIVVYIDNEEFGRMSKEATKEFIKEISGGRS
jgi:hypothetical protein